MQPQLRYELRLAQHGVALWPQAAAESRPLRSDGGLDGLSRHNLVGRGKHLTFRLAAQQGAWGLGRGLA